MKIVLTGRRRLEIQKNSKSEKSGKGQVRLQVLYCAICRTDAKMWDQGHRDLLLPRVPGHEMAVADSQGKRYVIWPGVSCGTCPHCRTGRENRCEHLQILGFHRDGGFADEIIAPADSLISVPETLDSAISCFAEPMGCIFHALANFPVKKNPRFLIYGGGTMGLLAGLVIHASGGKPMVIEKNKEKTLAAQPFLKATGIACTTNTTENGFDAVINACPDTQAFADGLKKLRKGGHFIFFSGLTKNATIGTDLIDLIHYHEITISGRYGLAPADMQRAVDFIDAHQRILATLVQGIVAPESAPGLLPQVLAGKGFKYILDFTASQIPEQPGQNNQ
ncbi:MAG: alcohol dehydrogenase catalytic domain-containing protein [Desulfobacterales bacterium]|nr:alcohol dehydrogenase catalytic domain-containing protein [Desulfobacterales bacterium]